jgi:hypothetical protein
VFYGFHTAQTLVRIKGVSAHDSSGSDSEKSVRSTSTLIDLYSDLIHT